MQNKVKLIIFSCKDEYTLSFSIYLDASDSKEQYFTCLYFRSMNILFSYSRLKLSLLQIDLIAVIYFQILFNFLSWNNLNKRIIKINLVKL